MGAIFIYLMYVAFAKGNGEAFAVAKVKLCYAQ